MVKLVLTLIIVLGIPYIFQEPKSYENGVNNIPVPRRGINPNKSLLRKGFRGGRRSCRANQKLQVSKNTEGFKNYDFTKN